MTATLTELTCANCHAAMAEDQRYCLMCGERRGAPRVAWPAPANTGATAPPPPPLVPPPAGAARSATAVWVGAVGVLLLAMGVGVLIGLAGRANPPAQARSAPVTVTVPSAGAVATPSAADTARTGDAKAGKGTRGKGRRGKAGASKAPKASKQELQQLDGLSPEQYGKRSKALPDKVGTSGTPAPKDSKPAGAGSDVETIG